MTDLYSVRNLDFSYSLGKQRVPALRQLSCAIAEGSLTALAGHRAPARARSCICSASLKRPRSAASCSSARTSAACRRRAKNHLRRHKLGFVFQSFHLFPTLRADENVAYFVARQGPAPRRPAGARARCPGGCGVVGARAHTPLEMSGGQRQRVAIAPALAKNQR